jgi:predicted metal-dependent hydrolase
VFDALSMSEQPGLFDRLDAPAVSGANRNFASLSVRESARARRLTLRLLPQTLELVVPSGTKPAQVAAFVREHRRWIERATRELPPPAARGDDGLPRRIELRAIGESWDVVYVSRALQRPAVRRAGGRLEVHAPHADGRVNEPAVVAASLRAWLRDQGALHLTPWLLEEARRLGTSPKAVQIRLQRTRWGSCSSNATVSLNAALLFLDSPVVRYLLVHELCHLRALDHSRRFWRAVERFEPNFRELDRALSGARPQVPLWVYPQKAAGIVLDAAL